MAKAKIMAIRKRVDKRDNDTLAYQLQQKGWNRIPGTAVMATPYREKDGTYRTGLDENAPYISLMGSKEQDIEKARIRGFKETIKKKYSDIKLFDNTSVYYTKMFDGSTEPRCKRIYLGDTNEELDLDNPEHAITFAWIRVHPIHTASSYEAFEAGNSNPRATHYISEYDTETKISYDERSEKNKAIALMENTDVEKRKKIARLLNLRVDDNTTEKQVYNILDEFINEKTVVSGIYKGQQSVPLFVETAKMKDENLNIANLVEEAFNLSILRMSNGSIMYGGEMLDVSDKQALIALLLSNKKEGQTLFIQLEKAVKTLKIAQ